MTKYICFAEHTKTFPIRVGRKETFRAEMLALKLKKNKEKVIYK